MKLMLIFDTAQNGIEVIRVCFFVDGNKSGAALERRFVVSECQLKRLSGDYWGKNLG